MENFDKLKSLNKDFEPLQHLSLLLNKGDDESMMKLCQFLKENSNIIHRKCHVAHGRTFVHVVSMANNVKVLKIFMKYGANINVLDDQQRTPLYYACKYCAFDAAKLLLEHGANVQRRTNLERTALHWAANHGNLEISEMLLKRGADPNVMTPSESASTPFHLTFRVRDVELVQLFIRYGANVHLKNWMGVNAIHLATYAGMLEIVEMLLVDIGLNPNEVDNNGMVPLHYAILSECNASRNLQMIKLLLKYGALLDIADKDGKTPLYTAVDLVKHMEIKLLVDEGANVNGISGKRSNGDTKPIFAALRHGDEKTMEMLLSRGATVDGQDSQGNGILHIAIKGFYGVKVKRDDLIEELVARGAQVNNRNLEGNSPLHVATDEDQLEQCCTLLDQGANPFLKNSSKLCPIDKAILSLPIEYTDMFLRERVIPNEEKAFLSFFEWALKSREEEKVDMLLDVGAQYVKPNEIATSTAAISSPLVMKVLLGRGIVQDLNANNDRGRTPIVIAIENWQIDMVHYLLEVGVHVVDRVTGKSDALVAALNLIKNNPDCIIADNITRLVLQHVAINIAQFNVRLCDEDSRMLRKKPVYAADYYRCLKETKRMCVTRVNGTHVTYLDLCTKRNNALIECLKFNDVRKGLASNLYRQLFPYNASYIESMCIRGMRRLQLIDTVSELLQETLFELQLPYTVTARIAEVMRTDDLETTAELGNRCLGGRRKKRIRRALNDNTMDWDYSFLSID